jgi:hypothetical protein
MNPGERIKGGLEVMEHSTQGGSARPFDPSSGTRRQRVSTTGRILATLAIALLGTLIATTGALAGKGKGGGGGGGGASPTATPLPCEACPEIHVLVMHVSGSKTQSGSQGVCRVFVEDALGNLITGAQVDIQWSGAVSGSGSALTQPHPEFGQDTPSAVIYSAPGPRCKGGNPSVIYTCSVVHVSKEGYRYAPENNNETSDQDDACRL